MKKRAEVKRGRVIRSRGTERGKGKENEREDGESCEDEGEKGEGCVRVWQQLDLILVVSDILTCKSTPLCASTLGHGLAALPCSKSTDGTISYN